MCSNSKCLSLVLFLYWYAEIHFLSHEMQLIVTHISVRTSSSVTALITICTSSVITAYSLYFSNRKTHWQFVGNRNTYINNLSSSVSELPNKCLKPIYYKKVGHMMFSRTRVFIIFVELQVHFLIVPKFKLKSVRIPYQFGKIVYIVKNQHLKKHFT